MGLNERILDYLFIICIEDINFPQNNITMGMEVWNQI